jgi:hypothetical protein
MCADADLTVRQGEEQAFRRGEHQGTLGPREPYTKTDNKDIACD